MPLPEENPKSIPVPLETMPTVLSSAPHPWNPAEIWKREAPIVKVTPTASAICFVAGCTLIYLLFSYFIIPGKDAQIHALEAKNAGSPLENKSNAMPVSQDGSTIHPEAQLYLKIKNIEIVPNSPASNPTRNPYRIIAHVNGHSLSFPSSQLCFTGSIKNDDSAPLPVDEIKYSIQFEREDISLKAFAPAPTNSSDSVYGGVTDEIQRNDKFPVLKTNSVAIKNWRSIGKEVIGTMVVIYEISK